MKIEHKHKCDKCGKPARWNLQNNWHLWHILPNGDFQDYKEWECGENKFYCDNCYGKEMR